MIKDFKKFAFKGNVADMAVGVIVGAAFSKIVSSLVNDVIMPVFGELTAGISFKALKYVLSPEIVTDGVVTKAENAILYGNFIQNIADFLVVALCLFFFIKFFTKLGEKARSKKTAEKEPEKKPDDIVLLTEIRDLLKEKN